VYELEYGKDAVEIHADAIEKGQRVLIVDDVLATGGTASATTRLVKQLGGDLHGLAFSSS
jgi:adenine phosphoribosyltransferase